MIFFGKNEKVYRNGGGSYDENGIWKEQGQQIEVTMDIQPMSPLQISRLPASWNVNGGAIEIYTSSKLNVWNDETKQKGDVVVWEGMRWRVRPGAHWNKFIPHYEYIGVYEGME
ncbi:hypothetical protein [Treponema sp. R6D11]